MKEIDNAKDLLVGNNLCALNNFRFWENSMSTS